MFGGPPFFFIGIVLQCNFQTAHLVGCWTQVNSRGCWLRLGGSWASLDATETTQNMKAVGSEMRAIAVRVCQPRGGEPTIVSSLKGLCCSALQRPVWARPLQACPILPLLFRPDFRPMPLWARPPGRQGEGPGPS